MQASEIWVLAPKYWPFELCGLPVYPAYFFVTLFLLTCFLAIPLGLGGFTCSCDGALLSGTTYRPTATRLNAGDWPPLAWVSIWDACLSG